MDGQTMYVDVAASLLAETPAKTKGEAVENFKERFNELLERAKDPNDPEANELLEFFRSNLRVQDVYTEGEFQAHRPDEDPNPLDIKVGGTA